MDLSRCNDGSGTRIRLLRVPTQLVYNGPHPIGRSDRGDRAGEWVSSTPQSSSTPRMFLIVQAQPIHSVVVLRVAHDGVDVIGLLHSEFDDHSRTMNAVVEGAAKIVCGTPPREVQLVDARLLDGLEVPLRRVSIRVADILFDQGEQ